MKATRLRDGCILACEAAAPAAAEAKEASALKAHVLSQACLEHLHMPSRHGDARVALQTGTAIELPPGDDLLEEDIDRASRLGDRHFFAVAEPQCMSEAWCLAQCPERRAMSMQRGEDRLSRIPVGEQLGRHIARVVHSQDQGAVPLQEQLQRAAVRYAGRILA